MFRHLAAHPEHRRALVDDPELIPSAVEEVLRYYTIIFGDGRKVTRDVEFHGASLRKGDMVYGLVSGANRDPRAYERADEYVIDRKRNHHMGFATARTAASARTSPAGRCSSRSASGCESSRTSTSPPARCSSSAAAAR